MSIDPVTGGGTAERTYQMSKAFAKLGIQSVLLTTNVGLKHQSIRNLKGIDIVVLAQTAAEEASNPELFRSLANHWRKIAAATSQQTATITGTNDFRGPNLDG